MTLVLDRREEFEGKPACHALIIGISEYTHLGRKDAIPPEPPGLFGLYKLSSPAITAFRLWEWLSDPKTKLAMPLASCRLLIAPSQHEIDNEPRLQALAGDCSLEAFEDYANTWRDDCARNTHNHAFFYFGGHGIQRTGDDTILLFQDFGRPGRSRIAETASVNNIHAGMAPNTAEDMALSQFFFIDACRNFPHELKDFASAEPPTVFDPVLGGADRRNSPIFFAAAPDTSAYGRVGVSTVFGEALIRCLKAAAREVYDQNANVSYGVYSRRLDECLSQCCAHLPKDQRIVTGGIIGDDVLIHTLPNAPLVEVNISLNPVSSFNSVDINLTDVNGSNRSYQKKQAAANLPISLTVPMGVYRLEVTSDPALNVIFPAISPVQPLQHTWRVSVK